MWSCLLQELFNMSNAHFPAVPGYLGNRAEQRALSAVPEGEDIAVPQGAVHPLQVQAAGADVAPGRPVNPASVTRTRASPMLDSAEVPMSESVQFNAN